LRNIQKLSEEISNQFNRKTHFKNYRFFKRVAKIRGENLPPNFIWLFSSALSRFTILFLLQ